MKRESTSVDATFEELQDLLLILARQMREMSPPHAVKELGQIESQVAEMKVRGNAKVALA